MKATANANASALESRANALLGEKPLECWGESLDLIGEWEPLVAGPEDMALAAQEEDDQEEDGQEEDDQDYWSGMAEAYEAYQPEEEDEQDEVSDLLALFK